LFLRGTGLKQLKEDYVNITKNIDSTQQVVQFKQKVIRINNQRFFQSLRKNLPFYSVNGMI